MKSEVSGKKEIKFRTEINEIEMKKTMEKISGTTSYFFGEINKIDKPLARLIRKKEIKIRN